MNLIGNPGDTVNAITVGSYDWSDNYHRTGGLISIGNPCGTKIDTGGLSCYSSAGPNRVFGGKPAVIKPEIVAPGEWYESAAAKDQGKMVGWGAEVPDITGNYHLMNGTSAATPYTAGVIALIFQKKPTLTFGQLRDLLTANVTKQDLRPFAVTPGGTWGYGKLDMAAIDRILAKL
jgi:subtilisin family serine protease